MMRCLMLLHDEWKLTADRIAYHLPTRSAVIADMHLGYVAARRGDGEAVPHFGEHEKIDHLLKVLHRRKLRSLVIAGDAVENATAGHGPLCGFVMGLREINVQAHLVLGNHDEHLADVPFLETHETGYQLD